MRFNFTSGVVPVAILFMITVNQAFSQEFTMKTFELSRDFLDSYKRSSLVDGRTIWYGNDQGVGRMDITTGSTLPALTGMNVDTVDFIKKDSQGRIWVMGHFSSQDGAGAAVRKGDGWKHFFNSQNAHNGLLDNAGSSMWMKYGYSGLIKMTSSDTVTYNDPNTYSIKEIEYDPNSGFWAIDNQSVYTLSSSGVWETDTTFAWYSLQDFHIDAQGTKWLIAYNEIWNRTNGTSNVYKSVPYPLPERAEFNSVTSDGLGNIYLGTYNKGVIVKTKTEWYALNTGNGLPFNNVFDIQVDERKNVWVFTEGYIEDGKNYKKVIFATALMNNGFPEDGELLHGIVFSDVNNNGQQDNGEPGIPNQMIKLQPSNAYAISNGEGKFSFHTATGENKISVLLKGFWEQGSTSLEYTFTYPNATLPEFNIGLKWGVVKDVAVSLVGNPLRPGFDANYYFYVSNEGSVTASTKLSFDYDPRLTFVSSNVTPSLTQNGHIEWPVNNLESLQSTSIRAVLNLPPSVALNTVIKHAGSVGTLAGETKLDNNLDSLITIVSGSFDPNDKLVEEGILEERYVVMDSKLTYTIRFQNTGTDTAFIVKIKDQLDPHLDITSLKILGSSHVMDYSLDGKLLRFSFPNIKLPDITHNEPLSHGYVRYSIKPLAGTINNTIVVNSASIYFDFNEPVLTNEVRNTLVNELPHEEILSVEERVSKNIVYPNPVTQRTLYLSEEASRFVRAELISLHGASLQEFSLQKGDSQLRLNSFPPGMYLLRLTDKNHKTVLTKVSIGQ
jgi:uncharacterized repeat protein (TIGR01451 family)